MHDRGSAHSTPRWVKVIAIIAIALLPLFVGLHLIGMSILGHVSGGNGDHARSPGAPEHRAQ
jgi:hypothetical protein